MHVDDNNEKEEEEGDFSSSFPTIPREYLEDFNSHNNHSYGTMIATATVTEESLVVIVPPVLAKYNQQEKHIMMMTVMMRLLLRMNITQL